MRKIPLVFLAVLCFALGARAQETRLDLLPGHGLGDAPAPETQGFRVSIGGEVWLRVVPVDDDHARLIGKDGVERIVELPPVAPPAFDPPAPPPLVLETPPVFVTGDFSTLYDGLAALLTDAVPAAPAEAWRFSAWLRLITEPGRLGHSHLTVAGRGSRLPDPELDRTVERFLAANPLPPLISGSALCELVVTVSGGARPVLSVWVGKPFAETATSLFSLTGGWLHQEPLGLPAAVLKSQAAAALRQTYETERNAARERLIAVLAENPSWPLFGWWNWDHRQTARLAEREIAAAPAGATAEMLLLGAKALAHGRKFAVAAKWATQAAAGTGDAALAAEARLLALNWSRRLPGAAAGDAPVDDKSIFRWEITAQSPAGSGDSKGALAVNWQRLRLLENEKSPRADRDLLWRGLAGRVAADLAAAVDREPSVVRFSRLQAWLNADEPSGAVILFDAGAELCARGHYPAAADVLRWLLADYPLSVLAPETGLRLLAVLNAAGEKEAARAVARQLAGDLAAESAWSLAVKEQGPVAVPLPVLAGRTKTAAAVREMVLRNVRDGEFAEFSRDRDPRALAAAERAARLLLDTIDNPAQRRADWLIFGRILAVDGKAADAATAYSNVALDETDDPLRLEALRDLAAVLTPDARRVAASLKNDPDWGGWLAGIRQ
ncbi:MAG: hypothetical protein GX444_15295 [Myxococcales bacterium]|nr:hypothetical protein [Myxococcales bacterium]